MKKNLPILLLTLALGISLVVACNHADKDKDNVLSATNNGTKPEYGGGPMPAFQISADSAQTWMKRWGVERNGIVQVLANSPVASDSTLLVYGFHIPRLELDSMLNYLGPNPNVWAMLAVKYDNTQNAFVPELVFAAEPNNTKADFSYYDFTAPCPTSCPQDKISR